MLRAQLIRSTTSYTRNRCLQRMAYSTSKEDFNPLRFKLSESDLSKYPILKVGHKQPVLDAVKIMADAGVGNVLVTTDDGRVVGIVTERDYVRKISLKNRRSKDTLVSEIMTPRPVAVTPNYNLEQCIATMIAAGCRRLPIIENGDVIGVVTIRYILEQIMNQLKEANFDLSRSVYGQSILTVLTEKTESGGGDQRFVTISPHSTVFDAMKTMSETGTGALIVSEFDDGIIDGIITERDHLTKLILNGRRSRDTKTSTIMTKAPLHEVGPETTVGVALELMVSKKIRHVPVVMHLVDSFSQEYRPMGVLSMKDIVNALYKGIKNV